MKEDFWYDDAIKDDPENVEGSEESECPICGDDAGQSCPCMQGDD